MNLREALIKVLGLASMCPLPVNSQRLATNDEAIEMFQAIVASDDVLIRVTQNDAARLAVLIGLKLSFKLNNSMTLAQAESLNTVYVQLPISGGLDHPCMESRRIK